MVLALSMMVVWPLLLLFSLVVDLLLRDWFSAAIDGALLAWFLWDFFGGSGKWKKGHKRLKEKVAVIKGRLKVVPVPA